MGVTAGRIIACCFGGRGKLIIETPLIYYYSLFFNSTEEKKNMSGFFYMLTSKMLGRVPSGGKLCEKKCQE